MTSFINWRVLIGVLAFAMMPMATVRPAWAQQRGPYPNKPITFVVPFTAGGPTDLIARTLAGPMSKALGQPIDVENVEGAGGTTGITQAGQAEPDGYTIMMGHMGTHGAAPAVFRGVLQYDPAKTFTPIGLAVGTPIVIVARKDFPAADLKSFVAIVRNGASQINQAHAGVGSVSQSTGLLFDSIVGAKPTFVVFRGTAPALTDLMSGLVDFMTDQIINVAPKIGSGAVKAYAIATRERSPVLPNVPTTAEAGLPEFEVSAWNAVFAPKNLPEEVKDKLVAALDKALDDEGVRKRIEGLGGVIPESERRGSAALQKLVESEVARWTPALRAGVDSTTEAP